MENLRLGVEFDIEGGIQKALKEVEKAPERLQKAFDKGKVDIKININEESLAGLKNRLKQLNNEFSIMKPADKFIFDDNGTITRLTDKAEKMKKEMLEVLEAIQANGKSLQDMANAEIKASAAAEKERKAKLEAQEKINKALAAEEDRINNINAKLKIHNEHLRSLEIGSSGWNRSALEVRRLTEELQAATQQIADFQQKAFQGLSGNITKNNVEQLTDYREELKALEREFNILKNKGGLKNADGSYSKEANDILDRQIAKQKEINDLIFSSDKARMQREDEITRKKERQLDIEKQIAQRNKVLTASENSIANVNAKLQIQRQRLESSDIGSNKYNKAAKEVERLTKRLEELQREMRKATGVEEQHTESVRTVTSAYREQSTYLSRLVQRMATYFAFSKTMEFLRNVREVTAQFELQRVSLGAIIQDQQRANSLFAEIKSFALSSPLKIMDLTTYTKQVAAYRIETDKLFDTTKRLADVSVGLGVDMGRLVLAYGQTKAASFLRAAEIRQYTEAGIPMLELLAEKFTALRGTMVSTEEVMDLVSKRAVSFKMVEEIFKDLTDAGGMFYNMQEKQSQTLYGMWSKLGDAASMMYEGIGKGAIVESSMKGVITLLNNLATNYNWWFETVKTGAAAFALYKASQGQWIFWLKTQNKAVMENIKVLKKKMEVENEILNKNEEEKKFKSLRNRVAITQEYESALSGGNFSTSEKIRLVRMSKGNEELKSAILNTKLLTQAQYDYIYSLGKGSTLLLQLKATIKSIGASLMGMLPVAIATAVFKLVFGIIEAWREHSREVEKINKAYGEQLNILQQIRNEYGQIVEDGGGFNQKLAVLQKLNKELAKFGMKNRIDISLASADNIDATIQSWTKKLEEANRLTRDWGEEMASVSTRFEFFGIYDNLNSDIKDLEKSFSKMTLNSDFKKGLEQMRLAVTDMSLTDKEGYKALSERIGLDAKLAIQQRGRNESELSYQKRIIENYNKMAGAFRLEKVDTSAYKANLKDVMGEIRKTTGIFDGSDVLTIRMAIDSYAATKEWNDTTRQAVIEDLNKKRLEAGVELIPEYSLDKIKDALTGFKSIVKTEFSKLYSEDDLRGFGSVVSLIDDAENKLKEYREQRAKLENVKVSTEYGSEAYKKQAEELDKLNAKIKEYSEALKKQEEAENRYREASRQYYSSEILKIQGTQKYKSDLDSIKLANQKNGIDKASLKILKDTVAEILRQDRATEELVNKEKERLDTMITEYELMTKRLTTMGDISEAVMSKFPNAIKELKGNLNLDPDAFFKKSDIAKLSTDAAGVLSSAYQKVNDILERQPKISTAELKNEEVQAAEKMVELQGELAKTEAGMNNLIGERLYNESEMLREKKNQTTDANELVKIEERILEITKNEAYIEYSKNKLNRDSINDSIKSLTPLKNAQETIKKQNEEYGEQKKLIEAIAKFLNVSLDKLKKGSGEDPYITLIKTRMKFMQDFQKGTEDLGKFLPGAKALGFQQENMKGRGKSVQIDTSALTGSREELIKWYENTIQAIIGKMRGFNDEWAQYGVQEFLSVDRSKVSDANRAYFQLLEELFKGLTDFRTDKMEKDLEKKLKDIQQRLERTKTAKEFFDGILGQTGDYNLAVTLTTSIYGDTSAHDMFVAMVDNIHEQFGNGIDISTAINFKAETIDYTELERLLDKMGDKEISEKNRESLKRIIADGKAANAKQVSEWLKMLNKENDYYKQRLTIEKTYREQRAKIQASGLPEDIVKSLTDVSIKKENEEKAKVDVEELTKSDEYIRAFENLGRVATSNLVKVEEAITSLIERHKELGDLSPEAMKTLTDALEKIRKEKVERDPLGGMVAGFKNALEYAKKLQAAKEKLEKVTAENKPLIAQEETKLEEQKKVKSGFTADKEEAQNQLAILEEQAAAGNKIFGWDEKVKELRALIVTLTQNEADAEKNILVTKAKIAELEGKIASAAAFVEYNTNGAKSGIKDFKTGAQQAAAGLNAMASLLGQVKELAGVTSDSTEGIAFDSAIQSLQMMAGLLTMIPPLVDAISKAMETNPVLLAVAAAMAVAMTIYNFLRNKKKADAEKQMKNLKKEVEGLEYAFSRLEKARERALGVEQFENYTAQYKNLSAQIQAEEKKIAVQEGLKKKDRNQDEIDASRKKIQELKDAQKDLNQTFSEDIAGFNAKDAAEDFASAWFDAYLSFGNTTKAIEKKFNDLIKNMVVKQLLAGVIKARLQKYIDQIGEMAKNGEEMTPEKLAGMYKQMTAEAKGATNDMEVMIKALQAQGMDVRSLAESAGLSGIGRDIATASEESINGLAQGINTQNFYISQISANVAGIWNLLSGGGVNLPQVQAGQSAGATHLEHLPTIATNTAETVKRCERAAVACEGMLGLMEKVVKPTGGVASHRVHVTYETTNTRR